MLKAFRCDFHIHTCLSPCAELDMYPRSVVMRAMEKKLDIIGICDHNAGENVRYVQQVAKDLPIVVLPGMELTSSEEVHVLALFDNLDPLMNLQELVYRHLPGKNDEDVFGCQAIVNDIDEVEAFNEHLLIGATDIPLMPLIGHIHEFGGLAIASHIDRESFSAISQLGFISDDMPFDALEVTVRVGMHNARFRYPELKRRPFIVSSDAHFVRDIGRGYTEIVLGEATIQELKMAFECQEGRYVRE
jgi:3',5'-nucleoside bisphosphate phosphatase